MTAALFQPLDYFLFVAVLFVSALIGVYYLLKEKWQIKESTSDDILMGGREMSVFPVAMSLIASYMSAITVLGVPTEMYVFGTQYWLVALSGFMTYPATCHIFLPFFHNLGLTSAYQYLELRFSRANRYVASLIFSTEMILYMAVVLYAPSLALNQVTGLSLWGSILSVGIVVTFYTSMGGLRAVLWTDTFQTFVVVCGLFGIIVVGSNHVGGLRKVWDIADMGGRVNFWNFNPSPFIRCTFWGLTIGSFIGQLTIYGANQTMLQRYMSISNVKKSQIALYISLPVTLLLVCLVCMAGLVIYAAYHDCDPLLSGSLISRDQLLPFFVMETLGNIPGIPGLFVACIFSAALSSISSCLNALSITLLEDILKPTMDSFNFRQFKPSEEARMAKILGVLGGAVVIAFAFLMSILGTTVLQIMISVLGMAGGPLLGLFLMGMFFPCVNAVGALAGLISSTLVIFWIVIGAFVFHAPLPELPFSTAGCESTINDVFGHFVTNIPNFNNLGIATTTPTIMESAVSDEWSGFMKIFLLSFLWYPTVAVIVALIVGIFTSWATGWTQESINPRFIYPVSEQLCCLLPSFMQRCFNCNRLWKYNLKLDTVLSDDDGDEEEEHFNRDYVKDKTRESANLLPKTTYRIDSFEAEVEDTSL